MEWINIIVAAACSLAGAFGGGSLLYIKTNRQLKKVEVVHSQADEWKRLYEESEEERKALSDKVDKLYKEQHTDRNTINSLKLEVQKLNWYRCTINGCKNRRPPHLYNNDGVEIEAQISQQ